MSETDNVIRLTVLFPEKKDWDEHYDPETCILTIPGEKPISTGARIRLDVAICDDGPRSILRGESLKPSSDGYARILFDNEEEAKLAYLQGFVRGGMLNLRKMRRLPVGLVVNYGTTTADRQSRTRDINEQGLFIIDDDPFSEGTRLFIEIFFPSEAEPFQVMGAVGHTVIVEDEDLPGMGIILDDGVQEQLTPIIDRLEEQFLKGKLPEDLLL